MTTTRDNPESSARSAQTVIRYLGDGDFVTRRYVSQGAEINTGEYTDHAMAVRDGMPIRDHFTLDTHGFRIATCPTAVGDFDDAAEVDAKYAAEVAEAVKALTGASFVAVQGWMRRTSADLSQRAAQKVAGYQHSGGLQPQAGEAHIDYNPRTGEAAGKRVYESQRPGGAGYSRHCCFSFWRTYSPGPQDWPLAMMDGRSIQGDELASNTLFVVDEFPVGDALTAPVEGEDQMIAATILRHRPQHRWWYFSNMAKDDALLFKFYDSDHSVTWRCPHTAFHDASLPDTRTRSSIEVRCVAFWE
ncbi:MAG: CmcJ/NvfI family oxidoreductase [Novosphingobium sp.]